MERLFEFDLWRSSATGAQVNGGDSSLRLRDFPSFTQPLRRSATRYGPSAPGYLFPNFSTSQLPSTVPPSYDASNLQDRILPSPRFNVLPREEEGRECLPAYSCSIRREAVFARKREFRSPFERACDRAWFKVYVILDGTMLKICRVRTTALAGRTSVHQVAANPDLPIAACAGMVLKTYTLQHAEVGNAADYTKRRYVIRLRVETDQFLLSCNAVETFLDWLEALSAAINLALPLEERSLPRYRIVPRHNMRQLAATQRDLRISHILNGTLRRRASSHPVLSHRLGDANRRPTDVQLSASVGTGRRWEGTANEGSVEETCPFGVRTVISSDPPSQQPFVSSASANRLPPSPSGRDSLQECSQQDDGKWHPPHRWTMARDIWYAHRCTTILCGDTPRQSDLIIKDGKRWKIDWAEERLVLLKEKTPRLPKYGEITKEGSRGAQSSD